MMSKKKRAKLKREREMAKIAEEKRLKKLGMHPEQVKNIKHEFKDYVPVRNKYLRETETYLSHYSIGRGNTERKESPQYTGDKLLGIATMHKSNMVPVFDSQSAEEISKMRRN